MEAYLKSGKLGESSSKSSGKSAAPKKPKSIHWVEKYRPKAVTEVVDQSDVVSVLEQCLTGADLPNLLFYGPPGTGKTSTILAAARQLFGDMYKNRILELNASDERGIQVIRDKVKSFAQLTASGVRPDGKPCPPFKIVILDEADSMTHAAQAALRRTMEKETKSTRFCLICNYVSRIIEPLTSRCTKFRFKPLNENLAYERLAYICEQENVLIDDNDKLLNLLVERSGGDMRKAITWLQSCAILSGHKQKIGLQHVQEVTGVVPAHWLEEFLKVCKESKEFSALDSFVKKLLYEAFAVSQILDQLNEKIINSDEFNDKQRTIIGEKLGDVSFHLQEGGTEYIQLIELGNSIMKAYSIV
ncbi:unnamed protein product [Phyllotreta striolata]|uniref:Replication factor C subunit 2 n=1 Tax=Phyllotreta striolata TaxID=444603 RepID=A0A9N9TXS9_PHYSR|nr:unnamed protein product [Phyllotreta striolata]